MLKIFAVIFPPMIWIFMWCEEPEIKSNQASKRDRLYTTKINWKGSSLFFTTLNKFSSLSPKLLSRKYYIFSKISGLSTILYNSSLNCLYKIAKHEKNSYIFLFIHILSLWFQFSFHFQKEVSIFRWMGEELNVQQRISHRAVRIEGLTYRTT